jgi:hypothetical protein
MSFPAAFECRRLSKGAFNGFGIRGETADQLLNHLLDLAEKARVE